MPYSRRSSVWFRRWLRLRPRGLAARSLAHAEYVRSAILRSASHSLLLWQASRQSGCFLRRKRPELPVASKSPAMHSAQANRRATFHFWVKKVNSTLPFSPIMQRNRFGFSDFVLSRYASPMIIVFTFVSSIWVVSYLTQQALGPALRRKKFPRR